MTTTPTRTCISCGERPKAAGQAYLCLICYYDAWARLEVGRVHLSGATYADYLYLDVPYKDDGWNGR